MVVALAVLTTLLAIWRRDWSLPKRAGLLFVFAYTLVVFQLATTGLAGSGRLGLLVFPLLALILVGSWAGWAAFGGRGMALVEVGFANGK